MNRTNNCVLELRWWPTTSTAKVENGWLDQSVPGTSRTVPGVLYPIPAVTVAYKRSELTTNTYLVRIGRRGCFKTQVCWWWRKRRTGMHPNIWHYLGTILFPGCYSLTQFVSQSSIGFVHRESGNIVWRWSRMTGIRGGESDTECHRFSVPSTPYWSSRWWTRVSVTVTITLIVTSLPITRPDAFELRW